MDTKIANEKFVIPANLTLTQCLDLLLSIVQNQYENLVRQLEKYKADQYFEKWPIIYKALDSLLIYVNEGLKRIEKKFKLSTGWSGLANENSSYRYTIENFKLLGYDIRTARTKVLDLINEVPDRTVKKKLLGSALSTSGSSTPGKLPSLHLGRLLGGKKKNEQHQRNREEVERQRREDVERIREERRIQFERAQMERQREGERKQKEREMLIELEVKKQVESLVQSRLEEERESTKRQTLRENKPVSRTKQQPQPSSRTSVEKKPFTSSVQERPRILSQADHKDRVTNNPPDNASRKPLGMRKNVKISSPVSAFNSDRRSMDLDINRAALLAWSTFSETGSLAPAVEKSKIPNAASRAVPRSSYGDQPKKRLPLTTAAKQAPRIRRTKSDEKVPQRTRKTNPKQKGSNLLIVPEGTPVSGNNAAQSPSKTIMDKIGPIGDGVDPAMCEQILTNIMVTGEKVYWDDIAGLNAAKNSLKEAVVYPFLRPDLFKGLREPIRGMLLFGPPGTGKTMIAKAIATESNSTFFSISASSLLSKYLGESEKLVKALFYVAKKTAPSIIFIDEIDSILGSRNDNENESSRRIKTEILIQWSNLSNMNVNADGTSADQRVLILAATNLPWVLDDAAVRRFSRRLYIPLPDFESRLYHVKNLMSKQKNVLSERDFLTIARLTDGYSGSDLTSLAKDAAMEPLRELGEALISANPDTIRGITLGDFESAMETIKSSVSPQVLHRFDAWAMKYGSSGC